jgi:hypothetical protein
MISRLMHIETSNKLHSYIEAIEVLYKANIFSLKGTRGITAFKSVTPLPQWQVIRHIHVSTMFLTPGRHMPAHKHFPPDNFTQWPITCQTLNEMQGLRSLRIEMIVRDIEYRNGSGSVDDDSLVYILEPLNRISVPIFEVGMNMPIPDGVLAKLGKLTFIPIVRQRSFNNRLTRLTF